MSPDQTPDVMPGVRDFKISMPFTRRAGEGTETVTMIVRLPAANEAAALQLGCFVAINVSNANAAVTDDLADVWKTDLTGIVITDVDGTPSIDEVAAERDHWRRIVTVLAGKMPGLTQVTADEYNAADISDLMLVPVDGQTMLFATEQSLTAAAGSPATLTPAPAGLALPDPYGGHPDPDVRQVKARTLPMFPPKAVELLHDGRWELVTDVTVTPELGIEVTFRDRTGKVVFSDLNADVVVRPAAVEAAAADLPAAGDHGRQVLTEYGWWTVAVAKRLTERGWYEATIVENPARRDAQGACLHTPGDNETTVCYSSPDEQVLLRDVPGSWWS